VHVPLAAHTESDDHTHELPAQSPQKVRLMTMVWFLKYDAGQLVPREKNANGLPHALGLGVPAVRSLHDRTHAHTRTG
jgi:hypothetical protein